MERVAVFIDGSNFYHNLHSYYERSDIDFSKFVNWMIGERSLVRTYYHNSPTKDAGKIKAQQRFFDILRRLPFFDVRLGRLEPRNNTYVEKGVDIAIAVDMLSLAYRNVYDTAILVSNDGDFAKAIQAVQDIGKHVEAATFPKAYHISNVADRVIRLFPDSLNPFFRK